MTPKVGEVCLTVMPPSRILLISANRCTTPEPVFPLGLAHLNATLRQAGHHTAWADNLADAGRLAEIARGFQPDFVGISLRNIDDVIIGRRETFFNELALIGAAVREAWACPIIVGGSGFSIFPEKLLALAGADFGIAGEGESSFLALISALRKGESYQSIPGLVFRQGDKIRVNPSLPSAPQSELADADRPPNVLAYYLQNGGMMNLQTQRGCAHRCAYCTYPLIEGRQHRRRSPETVAAEFEQLQRLGAKYAFIVDSVFNSSPRHVTEVCEALLRRGVRLPWGCFLRPQGLTADLMRLMGRAGLTHIEFGTDSFCDEVLAAYHKDFTFEDVLRSSRLAQAEKIDACHFLIAGGPGETMATLERGFKNAQQLERDTVMAVVGMRIYPGTHLFERAVRDGCIRRDTDLLTPAYYLAPGLTTEGVFARLQEFARHSPNWIPGQPNADYQRLVTRLRQRGVVGPLWSYFAMIQRLWPQGEENPKAEGRRPKEGRNPRSEVGGTRIGAG